MSRALPALALLVLFVDGAAVPAQAVTPRGGAHAGPFEGNTHPSNQAVRFRQERRQNAIAIAQARSLHVRERAIRAEERRMAAREADE